MTLTTTTNGDQEKVWFLIITHPILCTIWKFHCNMSIISNSFSYDFYVRKKSKPTIFGRRSLFYHLRLPMKRVNHGISRAYTGSVIKELSCTTNLSCSICSSDIESRIATLDSCISLFSFSFTTLDLLKREPLANPLQSLWKPLETTWEQRYKIFNFVINNFCKTKGQLISKWFLDFTTTHDTSGRLVFVRLEEIDDPKKAFRNQLTFK